MKKTLSITLCDTTLTINCLTNKYTVDKNGFVWETDGRSSHVRIQRVILGKRICIAQKPLSAALEISHTVVDNSIISIYRGFLTIFGKIALAVKTTATLFNDGAIDFSVETENERYGEVHSICFPGAFNAAQYKKSNAYSVDPARQGFIWPDDYKKRCSLLRAFALSRRDVNSGNCYMPLWGRITEGRGYSAYMENADDAAIFSSFGKGKAFLTAACWRPSLGTMRYRRTAHYKFYDQADYNVIAKQYRNFLIENGRLVTLKDKIALNPNVERLIGRPVIHTRILTNIQPKSRYYSKAHPERNQILHQTFFEKAEMLRKLKASGLNKAYVHTDGWGIAGYDNLHPYALPPCEDAGGWEGMKKLADTCREIDFIFGIHDQYRDQYFASPCYSKAESVENIDGDNPYCDIWDGGAHSWLCTALAPSYVKKTFTEFAEHGINIEAAYLDVFGIVPGDECFSTAHKIARNDSLNYRKQCFDYLRQNGIISSSEEPGSLMINSVDIVHHGPYAVVPQEGGPAIGVPIPLNNLVFHDCVIVPWIVDGRGGWGIPNGDKGRLHCILNAQSPYFNVEYTGDTIAQRIEKVCEAAAIQQKLWDKELVKHEFVDSSYRKQRTTYSDGSTIEVDFDLDTYNVSYARKE